MKAPGLSAVCWRPTTAEPRTGADCLQRPLRFRFRQRLTASVCAVQAVMLGRASLLSRGAWSRRTREAQRRLCEEASEGRVERRGGARDTHRRGGVVQAGRAGTRPGSPPATSGRYFINPAPMPRRYDSVPREPSPGPRDVACHGKGLRAADAALIPGEESADGRVGTRRAEGRNGGPERPWRWDCGTAPDQQLALPFAPQRGEAPVGASGGSPLVGDERLMERVVERPNLVTALARVKAHGGRPGIDRMTGAAWPDYLRQHWPERRAEGLTGRYRPRPVRRVASPKPGGGVRKCGRPTVLGRLIQQAGLHVLQPEGDQTCSEHSDGFRPGRSAPQAIARAQHSLAAGYDGVGDLDWGKGCARVNHDTLMRRVKARRAARRVRQLIARYLKAGALTGDGLEATVAGTPHGGPRSPLRANRLLDGFDKERERRGHRCVRQADARNISVQSLRAGQRVLARVRRCRERRLKRTVNAAKRAVDRPGRRTFLGFTFTRRRRPRRPGRVKALKALTQEGGQRTGRSRGGAGPRVVDDLRQSLDGWHAYFRGAAGQAPFKELDSWVRRRLRCYVGKHWGRRRARELRKRGGSQDLAWNTCKSAPGPWRRSRSPVRAIALPGQAFDRAGVPRLSRPLRRCDTPPNRRLRDPYVRWCGRGEAVRSPPIPIRRHSFSCEPGGER
jgi:group II intron reverse transcriptase/maturase